MIAASRFLRLLPDRTRDPDGMRVDEEGDVELTWPGLSVVVHPDFRFYWVAEPERGLGDCTASLPVELIMRFVGLCFD